MSTQVIGLRWETVAPRDKNSQTAKAAEAERRPCTGREIYGVGWRWLAAKWRWVAVKWRWVAVKWRWVAVTWRGPEAGDRALSADPVDQRSVERDGPDSDHVCTGRDGCCGILSGSASAGGRCIYGQAGYF